MFKNIRKATTGRRQFLQGVIGASAAFYATNNTSLAASSGATTHKDTKADSESKVQAAHAGARNEVASPAKGPRLTAKHSGSDIMVDAIKALQIPYILANPGSSFRGLQESFVNYGGNSKPEWLTCLHEATSVSMALGYARASGDKPLAVMLHSTVGVQNAAMSIYNAYADRVPIFMMSASFPDGAFRRPLAEWVHAAQDNAGMVRDYTKWDDAPGSIRHFAESAVRGYKIATSPPMGPVMLSVDAELQEHPAPQDPASFVLPKITPTSHPAGDYHQVEKLAADLVNAKMPVIVADRYARTEKALPLIVELAELIAAPVVDMGYRLNFPTNHYLNQSFNRRVIGNADVVLGIETGNFWGVLNKQTDQLEKTERQVVREDARIVTLGLEDIPHRSNYQDFMRYVERNQHIRGDGETTLPHLIEAVRRLINDGAKNRINKRQQAVKKLYQQRRARDEELASRGWNASPITTARMCMELYDLIKDEDWALTSMTFSVSFWPQRLWAMDKPQHYTGSLGAGGMGGNLGAALGGALYHRDKNRVCVNIQSDGDLMYTPGALWTAAHHKIPLLTVVHNNRAYHQETMHVQKMANRYERGVENAAIGTVIDDPAIDFGSLARSMGVWAEGPISQPEELRPALQRALKIVKQGEPALVDVISEPR